MTKVIFNYGGTLDKFVGDEIIALFGSPLPMEDHAFHASEAALKMQEMHAIIRMQLLSQGRELPPMGIAISSGEVIAGEFGPPDRTDFTAMGRTMNLGSRLCGAVEPDKVYITYSTRRMLGQRAKVRELSPVKLKGIEDMVVSFELLSLRK
jgi:adenylate cyclase